MQHTGCGVLLVVCTILHFTLGVIEGTRGTTKFDSSIFLFLGHPNMELAHRFLSDATQMTVLWCKLEPVCSTPLGSPLGSPSFGCFLTLGDTFGFHLNTNQIPTLKRAAKIHEKHIRSISHVRDKCFHPAKAFNRLVAPLHGSLFKCKMLDPPGSNTGPFPFQAFCKLGSIRAPIPTLSLPSSIAFSLFSFSSSVSGFSKPAKRSEASLSFSHGDLTKKVGNMDSNGPTGWGSWTGELNKKGKPKGQQFWLWASELNITPARLPSTKTRPYEPQSKHVLG